MKQLEGVLPEDVKPDTDEWRHIGKPEYGCGLPVGTLIESLCGTAFRTRGGYWQPHMTGPEFCPMCVTIALEDWRRSR